ncbi:MAG: alkaline phosphatase family protein [Bryobacteraceae bacterium]|nr:alkaline phosphatase family protein [Bryobacteraceae bacterium]MDW8377076.1 alkaline phosphatase family protein [Bryobacterales bacterium]
MPTFRVFFLLLWLGADLAAQTVWPKLVVAITVDQFRYDYLVRFRHHYTGGIDRLLRQGAVFSNAYYEHFPTVTAVGHSTFLSGATPSVSGIIGNDWYDRESGKQVTSVADDQESTLGGASRGAAKSASPRRLLVSTLGDELKMAGRGSKVIGIALKDRSAILPAGHMADGAYWFDPQSGNFASSTYYFDKLPAWVEEFNRSRFADRFAGLKWTSTSGGAALKTMPSALDVVYYSSLESSPYGNDLVEKFAEAAVIGERLGKRDATDLLAISFSANDYIGHQHGPDSPHVREVSILTDRLLGQFFQFLDAQVGMRQVLVVFTADHGVAPLPEVNVQRRMPGGRIAEKTIDAAIESTLAAKFGEGKWVVGKSGPSRYLNHELIRQKALNYVEVLEIAAEAVRAVPHIYRVYTRTDLRKGAVAGDRIDRRVLAGFHDKRAPDLTILADPYYLFESRGTSHGLPFQYDAHIPVIFMGPGVKPGRYDFPISANDIAPTLATLLDVLMPSGALGRALHEILLPFPASRSASPASAKPQRALGASTR